MPEPAMTYAIEPKSRADEDKLAPAIHKLMEEDLLIRFFRDPHDQRVPHCGRGTAAHRDHRFAAQEALSRRSYAESAQGALSRNHSRQGRRRTAGTRSRAAAMGSSATARFAWNRCRAERDSNSPTKSSVALFPRKFVPAVEKGIIESAARGYLAGYPVVDFKATVYDGSYHDVDSNEMSFKDCRASCVPQVHGAGQALLCSSPS